MLASFDPVALDQACADLVNAAPVMQNSILAEHIAANPEEAAKHDHFHNITPESEWKACLEHAEKIGMGTRSYELITVKEPRKIKREAYHNRCASLLPFYG